MPQVAPDFPFVLGLDVGAKSIGWAVVRLEDGDPREVVAAGVRCFEAGVRGQLEEGRDEAAGAERRAARQARRQISRRASRRRKLLHLLAANGLLPPLPDRSPATVHNYFLTLDRELRQRWAPGNERLDHQVFFYRLRARALDEELPLTHFGRVLYQFGQRRGFLSGRKTKPKEDEDLGTVKENIKTLAGDIARTGSRTLGEYLASLDPEEQRIRKRWTARSMYQEEFEKLWQSQARWHQELSEELKAEIGQVLFFQRPLRSQKHLVGECDLEPGRKRAPIASREAQLFRVLQAVNNLRLELPAPQGERALEADEREAVLARLLREGEVKFPALRSLLGLPRLSKFNLERGGEKRLIGHRTDVKMRAAFGAAWDELAEERRNEIVDQVMAIEEPAVLARKAEQEWGLTPGQAAVLSQTEFEPGYAAHSRRALRRLLPLMATGMAVATARKEIYPESLAARPPAERLPKVFEALPALRNPAVARSLSELRKVVNALLRRWGHPEIVRIELTRDLRNSRLRRKEIADRNRKREAEKEQATARLAEKGLTSPSRDDKEKYLLAEECGWECPYTGRSIAFGDLFGQNPSFDVEHIWPLSRSLDNSFFNKTLCELAENRAHKANRTPFEAYGADPERFQRILDRVSHFRGGARLEKLSRFASEEIPQDFTARHLQDTRYATKLAMRFLGELYGGTVDVEGRRRVQAGTGGLTALVRGQLGLNVILSGGPQKSREDHRHHAIDALAIALIDQGLVQRLSEAASGAAAAKRRNYAPMEPPWPEFLDQARRAIEDIVVSHRVDRRISGALHQANNYSRPIHIARDQPDSKERRIRRPVHLLSEKEIASIPDPAVREAVEKKLREVGKVNRLETDPPLLDAGGGRRVPIRRVRVPAAVKPVTVGVGERARHVESGSNHHLEVVAVLDETGGEKRWEGHLVSLLEAHRRHRAGEPVVRTEWGPQRRFKFTLASGESVALTEADGRERLARVRGVSHEDGAGRVTLTYLNDARLKAKIPRAELLRPMVDGLRKAACRKISVSPVGEISVACD